jgi:predicted ArsR family transcriptional regulator
LIVTDDLSKQRILTAIADPYSRMILRTIMHDNKSALELSKECGIPVTTMYRRIEELLGAGLIIQAKASRTKDGKWFELYRTLVKNINITAEKGSIAIAISLDNVPERLMHTSPTLNNLRSQAVARTA